MKKWGKTILQRGETWYCHNCFHSFDGVCHNGEAIKERGTILGNAKFCKYRIDYRTVQKKEFEETKAEIETSKMEEYL